MDIFSIHFQSKICIFLKLSFMFGFSGARSAYDLCFCDQADWEGYFGQLFNGRTGTPARPMHRSQQPIRIGYTELVLQLVLTIYGPSCTFLELIFPCVHTSVAYFLGGTDAHGNHHTTTASGCIIMSQRVETFLTIYMHKSFLRDE